jgi:hypothetical protein
VYVCCRTILTASGAIAPALALPGYVDVGYNNTAQCLDPNEARFRWAGTCFVPCEPKSACDPATANNPDRTLAGCAAGYSHPEMRCAQCSQGYYRRGEFCVSCPSAALGLFIGYLVLLVTITLFTYLAIHFKVSVLSLC